MTRSVIIAMGIGLVVSMGTAALAEGGAEMLVLPEVLDLTEAQRIALRKNPSLRSAQARVERAHSLVQQANAASWPTLSLGLTGSRTRLSDRTMNRIEEAPGWLGEDPVAEVDRILQAVNDEVTDATRRALESILLDYLAGQAPPAAGSSSAAQLVDGLDARFKPSIDQEQSYYWAGASGSWLLFDGFARRFARALARYGEEESVAARRDAQRLLLGAVATAYYQAQFAREKTTIAQADLDFNARLLGDARVRQEKGKGRLSTTLNFEVRRNMAESSLLAAQHEHETSRVTLAALMGIPEGALPITTSLAPLEQEREEEMAVPDAEAAIGYAVAHRSDLTFARAAVQRGEQGVRLARAAYSPTVNLIGGYGAGRPDDLSFDKEDVGAVVAMSVSFDVFRGGERGAVVREALALRADALALLSQAEIGAASEVRRALIALRSAGEQLRLQRLNLDVVTQARDLVEVEYKADHTSLVRLNEAQRDHVQARGRYARALAALHVAWHELQQATGKSLQRIE